MCTRMYMYRVYRRRWPLALPRRPPAFLSLSARGPHRHLPRRAPLREGQLTTRQGYPRAQSPHPSSPHDFYTRLTSHLLAALCRPEHQTARITAPSVYHISSLLALADVDAVAVVRRPVGRETAHAELVGDSRVLLRACVRARYGTVKQKARARQGKERARPGTEREPSEVREATRGVRAGIETTLAPALSIRMVLLFLAASDAAVACARMYWTTPLALPTR